MRFALNTVRFVGYASFTSLLYGRFCVDVKSGIPSRGSTHSSPVAFTTSDFAAASLPTTSLNVSVSTTTSPAAATAASTADAMIILS